MRRPSGLNATLKRISVCPLRVRVSKPGRDFAHLHYVTLPVGDGDPSAVGAERHALSSRHSRGDFPTGRGIEDPDGKIPPGCGDPPAIGAVCQCHAQCHAQAMPCEGADLLTGGGVPHLQLSHPRGGDPSAVGAERHVDDIAHTLEPEGADLLTGGGVPESHRPVAAGGGDLSLDRRG